MKGHRRALLRLGVLAATTGVLIAGPSLAAHAHPLGNATVNHYDGLRLSAHQVTDLAVEDIAEIPTLQRKGLIDSDGNGQLSPAERAAYAAKRCRSLARSDTITVNGRRLQLSVTRSDYSERPGAIQLQVGRLVCQLSSVTDLTGNSTLAIDDGWDGAGIGWHEITAVGTNVSLRQSPFPAASISDSLLHYPNDLLSSPLDVRSGAINVVPGAGTSTYAGARKLPGVGFAVRQLNQLATSFNNLVGSKHLTVGVGLLAVLLSIMLGAGHAFLPGHGKTIMAAYLVGRRGRLRDVVTVGATVTITHTAGVLILGLLISLTAAFAPTAAEQDLAILSGLIVASVGAGLLVTALRRIKTRRPFATETLTALTTPATTHQQERAFTHADSAVSLLSAGPEPPATVLHEHPAENSEHHAAHRDGQKLEDTHHEHRHAHTHHGHHGRSQPGHSHDPASFGRGGLIGLGIAGGLVPSPSALLVLLGAIALGRTIFGVALVLGYGLGMATALTAAGLLLVRLRNRLNRAAVGRRLQRANRLIIVLPALTATLVLLVGVGLTLRAVAGSI